MKGDKVTKAKTPLKSGKSRKKINTLKRFHVEENYRNIIDSISDGVFCLNTDGYVTVVNKAISERLGIPAEQFHSLHFLDVITPEYQEQAKRNFQRIMKGEEEIVSELKYEYADGQVRIVEVRSRPIRKDGKVVGLLGISRDISERKQSEEALKNQMEFVMTLLDTIASPVFYKDVSGRYLGCNNAFEEFLGRTRESIIGKDVYNISSADIAEKYEAMDNELFQQGGRQTYEWRVRAADGSERDVIYNKATFPDASGNIAGLVGVMIDITERKKAENDLRESEEKYRELVENANSIILRTDNVGVITFFNEFAQHFFGYKEEEILGKNGVGTIVPETESTGRDLRWMIEDIGRHPDRYVNNINENMRRDGSRVWIAWTNKPIFDDNGRVAEILCIGNDITERKHLEEALQKSERYFKAITENSSDIIFIINKKGTITYTSPSVERLLGYKQEELIGKNCLALILPVDHPRAIYDFGKAVLSKESVIPNAFCVRHKDGSVRVLEGVGNNLLDNPSVSGFVMNVRDVTERKQAEEALRLSEAKFRALAESSASAIFIIQGTKYIYVNPAFERMVGYTIDDLASMNFWDFMHPDFRELVKTRGLSRLDGAQPPSRYEIKFITKNGEEGWADFSATMIDLENKPTIIGSTFDITARKQSEDALRISEERHRLITDNMSDMIRFTDVNGTILYYSPSHEKILGYSPEERVGRNIMEFWHPDDRERVQAELRSALASKSPGKIDYRIKHADGHYIWLETARDFVSDVDGKIKAVIFSSRDITERKQAEEALRNSEEKYRLSFENVYDVIYTIDSNFKISSVSPSVGRILGYKVEELIGRPIQDLNILSPASLEDVISSIPLVFSGKEIPTSVYEFIAKDGTKKFGELIASPLRSDNTIIGIIGVGRDITERKQAEEALRESEERYRYLVKYAPTGIFEADFTARKYLSVNDVMCQYTGYTREEFLSLDPIQLLAEESMEAFIQRYAKVLAGEPVPDSIEFKVKRKDGSEFWVLLNTRYSYEANNRITATVIVYDITERKQAERALRESEEKYRTIIENMQEGYHEVDLKGNFTFFNESACRMLGYQKEELLGMNYRQYADEENSRRVYQVYNRVYQTGEPVKNFEWQIIRKDGDSRDSEVSISLIRDAEGHPTGFRSIVRDITERREAERAVRESEIKYRSVIENIEDVFYRSDLNGRLLMASPSGAEMFGYDMIDEMIGIPLDLFWANPGERGRLLEQIKRTGSVKDFEAVLKKKDGATFVASLTTHFYFGEHGNYLGTEGVIRDISERKRAEEALRSSEEKYRSIFENAVEGIYQSTPDGRFLSANPAYARMYGYMSAQEMTDNITDIGRQLYVNPKDRQEFRKILEKDGIIKGFEAQHYKKDGVRIWVRVNAILLNDATGRTLYNGFTEDITKQKIAEDEREKLLRQLQQAQKMEAIGTLAGGIAHDFNNILSAVLGYTEMALGEPKLDKELRRYLDQVFKAGERARDLVKQILSFSRQSDETLRPLRVSPIVREVMRLLRASLPSTIKISQEIHEDWDAILANPTQIYQILMNLCTNAAHAMRGKKGELKVSLVPVNVEPPDNLITHHDLSPGKYLRLTVGDTGAGIDNEIIDRIFDPFFTTKKPGEGTGLGLSVVHGIVKSYGGTITVRSEVGEGTEFNVYIPLLTEVEDKQEAKVEASIPGGKERILYVDDEAALVQLATSILSRLGYEVTGRTNSLEALELFRARPNSFDLVITDMTMPNMTGSELALHLMRIRPDIPVILCTGFSEAITQEKARALGVKDFIMKPIVQQQIAEAIRRSLDYKK